MFSNEAEQLLHFGTWQYNLATQAIVWSDGVYRILGYAPGEFELNFDSIISLLHPDDRQSTIDQIQFTITTGQPYAIQKRFIHKNNQIILVLSAGKLLYNEAGQPIELTGVFQGITEQGKEKERLKLLESVVVHTNDAVIITEAEPIELPGPKILYVNAAFTEMTGFTAEEVIGKTPRILQGTDTNKAELEKLKKALKAWQPCEITVLNYKKNGESFWCNMQIKPITNEQGWYTHWISIERDITEQKKLQTLLDESNELAQIGSFEIDVVKNKMYWSPITKKIREVPPDFEPDLQTGISFFYGDKNQSIIAQCVYNCIEKGTPWDEELEIITHKGNPKWVRTIGRAEFQNGQCIRVYGSFQDIDKRKRTEIELLKLYEERNTILESIGDGFFAVNAQWEVSYWNYMAEQLLKVTKTQILGKNLWEVFADFKQSLSWQNYHKALETQQVVHFEDYHHGLEQWFDISVYPTPNGLSVYFRDITTQKIAQEAIALSNERYDLIAKATNDCIWDWDLQKNVVVRPGKKLEQLIGHPLIPPEHVDAFWAEHVHPDDWQRITTHRTVLLNNPHENYWEDEYQFKKPNGQYAIVYDRGYIIRNKDGKAIRIIGASRDVTREKEHTNEIKRIQQNLDALINASNEFIWSIDINMKLITANKTYKQFIEAIDGVAPKEGDDIIRPSFTNAMNQKWEMLYHRALSGEAFSFEESVTHPITGKIIYNLITLTPILTASAEIIGVACYAKDITDVKKAGLQLELMNEDLKKHATALATSNAELEQFAYIVSHDLQEPLRMVASFLTQLEKKYAKQLDEQAKIYIHFAVDGAKRMRQIILDLLEYSRVGRMEEKAETIPVKALIDEIEILYRQQIKQKQAVIHAKNLPVLVQPKAPVRQVFLNLIQNALKYSKEGASPDIYIQATDAGHFWQFSVQDNGIGIDADYFEQIFIIFQRLHTRDEYGGSGMGLAIAKKIIENLGGEIWVESEPGKGSIFYFTIPKSAI
ncbi:MAG: PAS domain S-box protein [Sphingobacteriales bacterium]|uniref:PAS domain-containing protein n=1 Tax=Hydrotalea flava TaxID=714549 RepID=UPI0008312B46|nr:PAS domain-containing protein [Hydrotalea flava]RTL52341.1 MAG: PAS domain S-box protein [Sphingobacteriales bacterium]